jgi:hypothetical protein
MKSVRVLASIAIAAALAAACGGVSTVGNTLDEEDGGPPESESGAEPRIDASAAQPDAGTPGMPGINVSCQSAQSCPRSQVCCAALSLTGIDVACANSCALGSFQVCLTNAECTTSGEVCTASPLGVGGFCTAARDAGARGPIDSGAIEDGNAHDTSVADGNAPDSTDVADGNAHDSSDLGDGNARDAEIVVDASVVVEAASGNDAASDGGGADDQGMADDDGSADDDSSDGGGS